MIRILPTNKGGRPNFGGWIDTWSNLGIANMNAVDWITSDSTRFYIVGRNGGATTNCFRFSTRAAPTVFTTPVFPITTDLGCIVAKGDNDTVFIGTSRATNARVYSYVVSTNTFVNLNFPEFNLHDGISAIAMHPTNSDILFIGTASAAASGQASLWQFQIGSSTWTELFAFGNTARLVRNIMFNNGEMFVGFGSATASVSQLYRSTNVAFTAFTQIAGDSINGSWATGTMRGCEAYFAGNVLYCGTNGSTNGDAEFYKSTTRGQSWTKIGGDGINSGWTGKLLALRTVALGNKAVAGLGTGAGDAEVWQWDEATQLWTQIGGDSINGSWSNTRNATSFLYVDPLTNALMACGGNNTVNTSFFYTVAGGALSGVVPGFSYQPYPIFAMQT